MIKQTYSGLVSAASGILHKIKRGMSLVWQALCKRVLKLVRWVVRFYPRALVLLLSLGIGLGIGYLLIDKTPSYEVTKSAIVSIINEDDCGPIVTPELAYFDVLGDSYSGSIYTALVSYGMRVSLQPVSVNSSPRERFQYFICSRTIGAEVVAAGYGDGDIIPVTGELKLWKMNNGAWYVYSFEALGDL